MAEEQVLDNLKQLQKEMNERIDKVDEKLDRIEGAIRKVSNTYKSEQVLRLIRGLDNDERWKLLNELYDMYYNKGKHPKEKVEENY